MNTVSVPRSVSAPSDLRQTDVRKELRHIRDLVFIRDLLRARGETATELERCDAVIDEARTHLAESAKRVSTRFAAAA